MGLSLRPVVIDTRDLPVLARFWADVLNWRILSEREREVVKEQRPPEGASGRRREWDLNPRSPEAQRFSRPSDSATLASLRERS